MQLWQVEKGTCVLYSTTELRSDFLQNPYFRKNNSKNYIW